MALILVVDGDPLLGEVLQQRFQRQGHQALVAHTARDAQDLAERYCPDLIVSNAVLPQFKATEIYQRLKATPGLNGTPVLFYSFHLQVEEEPHVFAETGNSHVRRPCPLGELTRRTNSLLRRSHEPAPVLADHLIAGRLVVHTQNLTVQSNGRVSKLTPTEFELLRYLMLHVDEACSAKRLLQNVWGYPPGTGSTDLVRTHIRNLRHKLEECPQRPLHLRTIRHRGYMLCSNRKGQEREEQWLSDADVQDKESVRFSRTRI